MRLSGSQGVEYENGCLLRCRAVLSGRYLAEVSEVIIVSISLTMEAASTSYTSVNILNNPEGGHFRKSLFSL
jgi:hypothetical protein